MLILRKKKGRKLINKAKDFFHAYKKGLIVILCILIFILIATYYGVDRWIITGLVVVFGFFTQAFTIILSIISLIPVIGPIIVYVVSMPFFLILNGLGYIVFFISFRKGAKTGEDTKQIVKQAFLSRIITSAVLVGIVIGFILGKLL